MAIAKIIEISASSATSFEDAVKQGLAKAAETVHGIKGAWIAEQKVEVEDGAIVEYRVDMRVSFLVD